MGHSILPPSASDKWLNCPGWYHEVKDLPPSPSSVYAEEGTEAHSVLEVCLRFGFEPEDVTDDKEMAEAVGHALDWLRAYQIENPGAEYFPESWVSFGSWFKRPELGGTSDLIVDHPQELAVVDYKHGKGITVDPVTSSQLRLYLLGAIAKLGERDSYRLVIVQPRAFHSDGPVREHLVSAEEVRSFMNEVGHAIYKNFKGEPKKAGPHCRHFCQAAPRCRELARYSLELAAEEFGELIG